MVRVPGNSTSLKLPAPMGCDPFLFGNDAEPQGTIAKEGTCVSR